MQCSSVVVGTVEFKGPENVDALAGAEKGWGLCQRDPIPARDIIKETSVCALGGICALDAKRPLEAILCSGLFGNITAEPLSVAALLG